MWGIKTKDLKDILEFIYMGEVNIRQEDLESFLNLAQKLQIEGLNEHKEDSPQIKEEKIISSDHTIDGNLVTNKECIMIDSQWCFGRILRAQMEKWNISLN